MSRVPPESLTPAEAAVELALAIEEAQRQHAATISLPGGLVSLSHGMRERYCAEHERRVSALLWAHDLARRFSALADAERLSDLATAGRAS